MWTFPCFPLGSAHGNRGATNVTFLRWIGDALNVEMTSSDKIGADLFLKAKKEEEERERVWQACTEKFVRNSTRCGEGRSREN